MSNYLLHIPLYAVWHHKVFFFSPSHSSLSRSSSCSPPCFNSRHTHPHTHTRTLSLHICSSNLGENHTSPLPRSLSVPSLFSTSRSLNTGHRPAGHYAAFHRAGGARARLQPAHPPRPLSGRDCFQDRTHAQVRQLDPKTLPTFHAGLSITFFSLAPSRSAHFQPGSYVESRLFDPPLPFSVRVAILESSTCSSRLLGIRSEGTR